MKLDEAYRYAKPGSKGLMVRYPNTYAILPETGAVIPWEGPDGRYFRRCLNRGDIEIISKLENIEEVKKEVKENDNVVRGKRYGN